MLRVSNPKNLMNVTPEQKREAIRAETLRHREQLSFTARTTRSKQIAAHVTQWIQQTEETTLEAVMVYLSMKSEVQTYGLIDSLFTLGKRVIAPEVDVANRQLIPRHIQNLETDLVRHPYGMLQPNATCPVFPSMQLQLVLVPGIAFDVNGYRLGYGKGFYDRFLPTCPNAVTIGLAYQLQLVEETYPQPWDVPVQHIFTENGRIAISSRAR